jgi:microcystin-dependent protein
MRGRVPIGYGDSPDAAAPTVYSTIGAKFGAETVALAITNMPSHNHPLDVGDGAGSLAKTSWMDRNSGHGHGLNNTGTHQHYTNTNIEIAGSLANDTQINWLINAKSTGGNYLLTNAGEGGHDHGGVAGTDTNHRHDIAAQGSGTAHENRQPSTVLNFIMKVA